MKMKQNNTKPEKNESVKTQNGMKNFQTTSAVGLQRMHCHRIVCYRSPQTC